MVRDGDVLAALIVPSDTVQKLDSGLDPPELEVLVNEEDPLKARVVDDAIEAAIADANRRVSRALTRTSIEYLNLLLDGGNVNVLGREFTVLGLRRIGEAIEAARKRLPRGSEERRALDQVLTFNRLARENFGLSSQGPDLDQPADPCRQANGRRLPRAADDVRGSSRRGRVADVRDGAAGGRRACARAGAEHVHPTRARAGVAGEAAGREGRVRGRRLGAAHPADAAGRVRVRARRVGPVPPVAARRGGRRGGVRRDGDPDRSARTRGADGLPARLHAAAAGRVPGAGAGGSPELRALRRDAGRLCAVPVRRHASTPPRSALYGEGELAGPAGAPGGAWRSPTASQRAWRSRGSDRSRRWGTGYPVRACPFRPRGSDGCGRPAAFAAWCARPSCRSVISCTRCSSRMARTGASRSSRCPASSG